MPHLTVIRNDTFAGLRMLVTVKMNGNFRLTEIEARAFGQADANQVVVANLSGNALTTLHASTLYWTDVDVLDLRDNPWRCDCHLAWVKRLSTEVASQIT
ncbi:hypothetical protein NP493_75g03017 [Ridgeia piscesae]|uniref:Uncharacterized protein n=1 Tax=Ridgeia piscesae TaxID=27915 RepID=A0AAD9P999_RIDPI|nr:hypothetical protein NP493_75g03017 [Ridgeia piscesae]